MDYRIDDQDIRREYLEKYFYWSLRMYDCDSNLFLLNYIEDRLELNIEQRYWMSWLYGNTYNIATAWVIANEFPDFENVDLERLREWNNINYKRLRYQSDQKWQKGYLPEMYDSYRKNVFSYGNNQREFFNSFLVDDPIQSFYSLYNKIVKDFYKFGRYSTWFYLQTLKETCDLSINPDSLFLDNDNTHTQRDGLCYSLALDYLVGDKNLYKDREIVSILDNYSREFVDSFNNKYIDVKADMFLLETVLCAFKKTFRKKNGRYLGYYLDRQFEDIKQVENDGWIGIDWELLYDGRKEILDERVNRNTGVIKEDMEYFLDTGKIKYIDYVH